MLRAHRAVWKLENGPINDGLYVCHHCDNRMCCNPLHLFLGTAKDNAVDKVQKGRHFMRARLTPRQTDGPGCSAN